MMSSVASRDAGVNVCNACTCVLYTISFLRNALKILKYRRVTNRIYRDILGNFFYENQRKKHNYINVRLQIICTLFSNIFNETICRFPTISFI